MAKKQDQYIKVWVDCPYLKRRQTRFVDVDTVDNEALARIHWINEHLVRAINTAFRLREPIRLEVL